MDRDTSEDRERKKGSAEMLVLSALEGRPRHGYEVAKLIESRSDGRLAFHVASLYAMLYRMESRGLIEGRWVEKGGQRRRRHYRITATGRRALSAQRRAWEDFIRALESAASLRHA